MSYQITWLPNGVLIQFEGKILIDEVNLANNALYSDPRFDDCSFQIFDFGSADLSDITLEHTRATAMSDAAISRDKPEPSLAIVSKHPITNALVYHYRRLAEVNHIKWNVESFHTQDEAKQWLATLS